jgi:hypothetical protein
VRNCFGWNNRTFVGLTLQVVMILQPNSLHLFNNHFENRTDLGEMGKQPITATVGHFKAT